MPDGPRPTTLAELARLFLKLGTIGFGGPAAHIALMEEEVVRRRGWLTPQQFLDLVGATNLIPGPNSTELAIHIGRARAGVPGLIVAGACFILPAAVIVATIAWAYRRYGTLPEASSLLYGVKPVVLAIVVRAIAVLGRTAIVSGPLAALAVAALAASLIGHVHELIVLLVAGMIGAVLALRTSRSSEVLGVLPLAGLWQVPAAIASAVSVGAPMSLSSLFLVFAKAGSVLFGSGYVLLAFLRADLVERLGWLSDAQLLDAIAVGQITPGPVFTTATFIGYQLAGWSGAAIATLAIFAPAFVFVALSAPLIPRLRRSRVASGVLDGVNVASLALMAGVTIVLARDAVVDIPTAVLAATSLLLLTFTPIGSMWLLIVAALVGLFVGRPA
jgi:chromate transporter